MCCINAWLSVLNIENEDNSEQNKIKINAYVGFYLIFL